jgi:hypothetical protein
VVEIERLMQVFMPDGLGADRSLRFLAAPLRTADLPGVKDI